MPHIMNKKALSAVIVTLMLIALALVAITIVWVVVNNLIEEGLEDVESCANIFDKVQINERYTCYNSSDNELQFSINIGDLEVEGIRVSVSGGGTSSSFEFDKTPRTVSGLTNYSDGGDIVFIPKKNSGLTYVYDVSGLPESPDSIQIAPIINGKQCGVSDAAYDFPACYLL